MISCEPDFVVVGTASSGADALRKIAVLDPDVVTLDVEMPGIDGLATLHCIMHRSPRPVIMVSASTEKDAEVTFNALSVGAFDYVPKQLSPESLEIAHIRSDLVCKIRAAAQSRRSASSIPRDRKPPQSCSFKPADIDMPTPAIVAIGASTGGPKALEAILSRLPPDLPVPILIVQHIPAGFTAPFAQRLNRLCSIEVHEAHPNELILPGVAYVGPSGIHMRVQRRLSDFRIVISLDAHPLNVLHTPSVDVLMESVAEIYNDCAFGIILTGMGSDGAHGMKAIYYKGGLTVGQDESSCAVYGMPRACAELGVLTRVLPLSEIPAQILNLTRRRKPA